MSKLNGMHDDNEEQTLRQLVRGLHDKMDKHAKKTDRINMILFGDEEGGIKGMVSKVQYHEKYINRDKKIKWLGAGTVLSGGTGIAFWDKIIEYFSK